MWLQFETWKLAMFIPILTWWIADTNEVLQIFINFDCPTQAIIIL